MCSCPTCSAGRSSTTSSSTRAPGTSRCRCSPSRRRAQHGLSHGAFAYLVKPATTSELESAFERLKTYVAAAHEAAARHRGQSTASATASSSCWSTTTSRSPPWGRAATRSKPCASTHYDCCVVDLRLPDMSGFELLDKLQAEPDLHDIPIVVFTGKELTAGGRAAAPHRGQERRAQGRAVARAPVRRDRPVPAPRDRPTCPKASAR